MKLFTNEMQVTARGRLRSWHTRRSIRLCWRIARRSAPPCSPKVPPEYLELASGGHGLNGPRWDAGQTQSLASLGEMRFTPVVEEEKSTAPSHYGKSLQDARLLSVSLSRFEPCTWHRELRFAPALD